MVSDRIINAINAGELNTSNVSFSAIKDYGHDSGHDMWGELGRGRAILSSIDQLDQYLYSYGGMIQGQWDTFLAGIELPLDDKAVCITDYGCGQGLATALLFDNVGPALCSKTSKITLIEPSLLALTRAKSIVSIYCPHLEVQTINKKLDDLIQNDLQNCSDATNVHIFSNILDIEGFDTVAVFDKMFKTAGQHIILGVSHDRDFDGGSERIRKLDKWVQNPKHSKWLQIQKSNINEFDCPNQKPAISWELRLEVVK